MKIKLLSAILMILCLCSFSEEKRKPVIFMIGDSTMATKNLANMNPERGWGHMLPGFLSDGITVDNHAKNGASTKSFITEGRWDKVVERIRPGDYVFIEFGHNDAPHKGERSTVAGGSYDDNLRRFVTETRSKGGKPVLFTSIVRRKFNEDSTLVDTHGAYIQAVKNVAAELKVPMVDLNALTHKFVQELGVERSKDYFMHVAPGTIPLCPEGRQDDTHLNVKGARAVASIAVDAIAKEVPELAQYVRHYDFVVAKDGSGDFFTVQEAINAVPDLRGSRRTTILVREGEYKEKIIVPKSKINLSLIGQGNAVLTYDDYASKTNIFGEEMGTAGSSSCYIYAPDFYAENITFANSAGPVGQAVACFVDGDRAVFRNCRFTGHQDTLYTHGEGRQYYENCYIDGTVDFIFGKATALFSGCQIHAKRKGGYLTAPATPKGQRHGYVFSHCTLTADEGVEQVWLSRPWRDYGQTVFLHCDMGSHIRPEGWHNWNKPHREKTAFYAEYGNTGTGADTSARAFGKRLKNDKGYTMADILSGSDNWNPLEVAYTPVAVVYP